MDGVTILNSFEVVTETTFSWQAFWVGVTIGVVISIICSIIFAVNELDILAGVTMFIVMSLLLPTFLGFLCGKVVAPDPVAYETQYEVSVNEDVGMQEFLDKYEILETRGSIYTVREKD